MKSFHSPSSSSSSSTPETRPNYATNGCLSSILRRFLGLHTLPTLPFDHHIKETFHSNEFNELKGGGGNPGIVAKLMGLDSMPFELRKKGNRVLEVPRFVELENDKFIVLSFEGDGKDKELKLNSSKKRNNKKNQETHVCQSPKNSCELFNLKAEFDSKKLCDIESDSEKSSPVSVLEFPDHQQTSLSGKEDSKSKNSNSRRKLRGDLDKNAASSSRSSCNSTDVGVESSSNGKKFVGLNKNSFRIRDFNEMWEEVSEMAERDIIERWKGEDIEEIGVCFGLQILDQLILELFTVHDNDFDL